MSGHNIKIQMSIFNNFNFSKQKNDTVAITTENSKDEITSFAFAEQSRLPLVKEISGKDYVQYGEANDHPNFLIELYNSSPVHQAICKTKARMVSGLNIAIDYKDMNEKEIMNLNSLLDFADGKNSLHTLTKTLALDFQVFGAMAIEIIWSMDFSSIATIKRIDVSKIRSGKLVDDEVQEYYYSRNWKDRKEEIKIIPVFDKNNKKDYNQILYVKKQGLGTEYYGVPDYTASIDWIQLDSQIGLYHRSNIENGFSPSFAIKFLKKPKTEDEKRSLVQGIKASFGGAKNSGKAMIFFSDNKDSAPIIEPITVNDLDKQYIAIAEQTVTQILTGHCVTSPALFGIRTVATLGNSSEELKVSYQTFNNTVVEPDRQVMEQTINTILKASGFNVIATLTEFNPLAGL